MLVGIMKWGQGLIRITCYAECDLLRSTLTGQLWSSLCQVQIQQNFVMKASAQIVSFKKQSAPFVVRVRRGVSWNRVYWACRRR